MPDIIFDSVSDSAREPAGSGVPRRTFLAATGVAAAVTVGEIAAAAAAAPALAGGLPTPAAEPRPQGSGGGGNGGAGGNGAASSEPFQTGQPPETPGAGAAAPPAPAKPGELLPALRLQPITAQTELESQYAPTAAPHDSHVGIAVVGLGRLSLEQILPAFAQSKRCRIAALVSGHRAKALQVARQYGVSPDAVYDYAGFDRIKDNADIQAVYIVLPNALHREYTVRAAQAGKHVLTEKPMATSPAECEAMIDACRKADRRLMVAYRIQYEPHHRTVRRLIENQNFGPIKVIESHNIQNQGGDLSQWRLNKALAGGGSLPDIGLYCLNTLRFLTGEEPTELVARIYTTPGDPRFKSVEETVTWQMRFPSGIETVCTCSYGGHDSKRYRVNGDRAWAEMNPAFQYHGLQLTMGHKSAVDPQADVQEKFTIEEKNQFALEMDHFASCVIDNKTPWTPGEEGLQDHRLMEAIYRSAQEGRIIRLPEAGKRDAFRGTPPI